MKTTKIISKKLEDIRIRLPLAIIVAIAIAALVITGFSIFNFHEDLNFYRSNANYQHWSGDSGENYTKVKKAYGEFINSNPIAKFETKYELIACAIIFFLILLELWLFCPFLFVKKYKWENKKTNKMILYKIKITDEMSEIQKNSAKITNSLIEAILTEDDFDIV